MNIQDTLNERGERYGEFRDVANTTQGMMDFVRNGRSSYELTTAQQEALHMICNKIARIVNGDPSYDDNWRDICGYSQLILNELEKS